MSKDEHRTVWSSDSGDLRKQKETRAGGSSLPPAQQTVYLHRESSGRGGKAVTLLKNLVLSPEDLKALAKRLNRNAAPEGRSGRG